MIKILDKSYYTLTLIIVHWLLTNIYMCLKKNTVSTGFRCAPSLLQGYLREDIEKFKGNPLDIMLL